MRRLNNRRKDHSGRLLIVSGLVLSGFLMNGCASFQKPVSEMTADEFKEAARDQAYLGDFLSGGQLSRQQR